MRTPLRRRLALTLSLLMPLALANPSAPANAGLICGIIIKCVHDHQLRAKAAPDECFNGIGVPYPAGPPCAAGREKVNQAYVWGMALVGDLLWFGTGANVNCIVGGATLNTPQPIEIDDYVCEFGQSQIAQANPALPASFGDHRRPEVFIYNTASRSLTRKTQDIENASTADRARLRTTLGLRAGGTHNGVVLLGGPGSANSINLFAFDGQTGAFLGSANYPAYGNIRHFIVAGGALYAGVGVGRNGELGGYVLRWTGSRTNPFSFVSVATLPAQAADLTEFDGRIFVSTWPTPGAPTPAQTAGLWMSPPLANGAPGLNPEDANSWQQVWNARMYEPEPYVASTYGLGGLSAHDGYLFWGTMHVPLKSAAVFTAAHPQPPGEATCNAVYKTNRGTSIWRGRNFGAASPQIDLLYGESQLPTYSAGIWGTSPTGYTPMHGSSGFGNNFNNYEWVMTEAAGRLYVGTMDWSYLILGRLGTGICGDYEFPDGYNDWGGDLWMFDDPSAPARRVDSTGVGNKLNYGIRNMISDGSELYLGMANPMNLRQTPQDNLLELLGRVLKPGQQDARRGGGWELIEIYVGNG